MVAAAVKRFCRKPRPLQAADFGLRIELRAKADLAASAAVSRDEFGAPPLPVRAPALPVCAYSIRDDWGNELFVAGAGEISHGKEHFSLSDL
jgi:hypothetical protein